jgi:release factor glutamine methyltransferase
VTIREALAQARRELGGVGIPDSGLEAEVLVMHASGLTREQLFAGPDEQLSPEAARGLASVLQRRLQREPLAYVTGSREFFGLDFRVDHRVLVPRQETETLVEETLARVREHFPDGECRIVDVGAGSGVIAVSLAKSLPRAQVYATDISSEALEVATLNCQRHGVDDRVTLFQGDLLDPAPPEVDVVVANLPYVPASEWDGLQPEIRLFEPRQALVSGETGLELAERLLDQVAQLDPAPALVLMELGEGQAEVIHQRSEAPFAGWAVSRYRDLGGLDRGVVLDDMRNRRKPLAV